MRRVGLSLRPVRPLVPYHLILQRWLRSSFSPQACRVDLERIILDHDISSQFFDLSGFETGKHVVTDALLFDAYQSAEEWELVLVRMHDDADVSSGVFDAAAIPALSEVLRSAMHAADARSFCERWTGDVDPDLLALLAAVPDSLRMPSSWPVVDAPGIYRHEHASLLIRTPTTTLLLDPLCMAVGLLPQIGSTPLELGLSSVDAILITHGHGDHWHLPSVLCGASSPDVPVFVPELPHKSILSDEDFCVSLSLVGQRAHVARWNTTFSVGDVEIDVLPFFGEQPTRDAPGADKRIRNFGNCYRLNTPTFSALILVDSGADPLGDMTEVVRRSYEQRGPADVLLACVRKFPSPFFGGLPSYWAPLSFERVQHLYRAFNSGHLPPTTAGPEGIVNLCVEGRVRYFLPYANGFQGVGKEISDVGWGLGEPSEAAVIEHITDSLVRRGATTKTMVWKPGDRAVFDRGLLEIRRL